MNEDFTFQDSTGLDQVKCVSSCIMRMRVLHMLSTGNRRQRRGRLSQKSTTNRRLVLDEQSKGQVEQKPKEELDTHCSGNLQVNRITSQVSQKSNFNEDFQEDKALIWTFIGTSSQLWKAVRNKN
ncbi:hypothetical protein Y1Q_0003879 [Alligator mississippiensis]|uniref:Uncharacterized protein n=1 Tax=Alligator mississippiensis TaxID=8496 RepID=A0A151MNJ9_ALLMI|nr:hypothetical protein Y1Q_0003879 [Alligator mississippiensis]